MHSTVYKLMSASYLAGDFDTPAMKRMVEQYLGPWAVAEGQPPEAPAIPNPPLPPQTTAGTVRSDEMCILTVKSVTPRPLV